MVLNSQNKFCVIFICFLFAHNSTQLSHILQAFCKNISLKQYI